MRRLLRREEGQALVEFAFVLPILALLVFGVVQMGAYITEHITLRDAVRAATRQAITCRFTPTPTPQTVFGNVANPALSPDPSITSPNFTVVYSTGSCTEGAKVTVTSQYTYNFKITVIDVPATITTTSVGVVE